MIALESDPDGSYGTLDVDVASSPVEDTDSHCTHASPSRRPKKGFAASNHSGDHLIRASIVLFTGLGIRVAQKP
jgi:hypothetical protein